MRKIIRSILVILALIVGAMHVLAERIITIEQIDYVYSQTIYWATIALMVIAILSLINLFFLVRAKNKEEEN